jgi:hypothetical protein
MRNLLRPRFLDLLWDTVEFDELAECWLCLYERADAKMSFRARPYYALEIRLRGFACCRTEAVEAELCRRLLTPAFPGPLVFRPDPDTLAFTSGCANLTEQPVEGLGLYLLRGKPFDGLLVEVRFTAAGFRHGPEGKSKAEGTVIVVGELRDGRVLVKSLWKTGPTGWEDVPHWSTPWADEPNLLGALSKFRVTGTVPDDLASKCFTSRFADRVGQLSVALTSVPLDQPRLGGLLLRSLIFVTAFAIAANVAAIAVVAGLWFLLVLPLFVFLLFGVLFCAFAIQELRLFFAGRAALRRMYVRLYAGHKHIVPLSPEEAADRLNNPWARKYFAELLALGCAHAGDFRMDTEEGGRSAMSLFFAPDGVTHVFLILSLGGSAPDYVPMISLMWPAAVVLMAETNCADGARLASVNNFYEGFRKKRSGPESQFRVFPDASAPAEFLSRHTEAMRRFASATGRTPAPHGSTEEIIRRDEQKQEKNRELYGDAPYTWMDNLHRYLCVVRREYRE